MAAPFYRVLIKSNNRDITDLIESFRYEDSVEKTDILELGMRTDAPGIVDDPDLQEGKQLLFSFGFRHRQSGKRLMQIEDVEPRFGATVQLMIKAYDLGLMMKKDERLDVWEKKKVSDIAKAIAERNGLRTNITETTKVHESLPQGGKTDYDFLQYLATIETDGSYRFFVSEDVLNFNKIDLKQDSQKTFRYGDPDGVVLSFAPRTGGSTKKNASASTQVAGIDPLTGDVWEQKVDNTNAVDDTKLGDYPIHYNADGIRITKPSQAAKEEAKVGKNIVKPSDSADEGLNVANKEKKGAAMDDITATLNIEGDPYLHSDTIITVSNVGKKFSGNWYINSVTHNISKGSPYLASVDLKRNASKTNVSQSAEATDKNNTTGADDNKQEKAVKLYVYNANGEEAS